MAESRWPGTCEEGHRLSEVYRYLAGLLALPKILVRVE